MSEVRVAVSLDAEALLSGFGDYIGLPGLSFGERGFIGLLFDDHALSILYDGARDAFLLYGPVCAVTPHAGESFFRRLAGEGHLSVFCGDGALTFDEASGRIVWSDRVPLAGLTQERFQEALKSAVDRIEFLKGSLFDILHRGDGASAPFGGDAPAATGFVRI
ncbi:MAG: type III secretion system chaperone [Pseudochelatococcus sp.]|jgi:hypothetical protein|uniref:type III secretion system chaperone n=1 Tax=Pseudochelatococcus sp. TaxID=2020869 RepID=UPI003D8C1E77